MGESFWVDAPTRRAGGVERVVVPDCRFPDEVDDIRRLGGVVVRITRGGAGASNGIVGHVSEQGDFPVDATIANDNTKSDLHAGLKETLEPLGFWNRSRGTIRDRLHGWFWWTAGTVSGILALY
jgi:hypothetical protein